MKTFVFSDIHGNSNVLKDLLKAWDNIKPDRIIFLGDIYGYYYGQKEICEFFRLHNVICLLGNHDYMALRLFDGQLLLDDISRKYGKGYNNIFNESEDGIAWLQSLSPTYQIKMGSHKCLFVHGDHIDNLNGRVYPNTPVNIDFEDWDILFCGHTHIPCIRKVGDKLIVNVGSIGQPRNGDLAQAVIFDADYGSIEFISFNWHPEKIRKDLELYGDNDLDHVKILKRKRFNS
jgi:putative phosphoesterase